MFFGGGGVASTKENRNSSLISNREWLDGVGRTIMPCGCMGVFVVDGCRASDLIFHRHG